MRAIRVDITGTTDASGNFSQTIRLDKTDEWRNLKVAIGTTGPAEWALTTSGTPLTYGRGRRVTLGPELLQPFDTLTVSCTGGPANAAVLGSCTGMAGSEQELVASYTPAPNTIALDTVAPRLALRPQTVATSLATPSFAVTSGGLSGAQIFTIAPGCIALRILVTAGGLAFTYNLLVLGRQSNVQYFGQVSSPGTSAAVPSPTLPITIPIDVDWDTQIEIHVENPTQNVNVFVSSLFDVEAPGQAGAAQSVTMPAPALWQAPTSNMFNFQAGIGTQVILAAGTGTVRLWDGVLDILTGAAGAQAAVQDTSGNVLAQCGAAAAKTFSCGFIARQLPPGLGVQIVVAGGAATAQFAAGYSRG